MLSLHRYESIAWSEGVATSCSLHLTGTRQHIGTEVIVPVGVADVLLGHHTIPLTTCNVFVVRSIESGITIETLLHTLCPAVGIRIVALCTVLVHRLCVIHIIDVSSCLYREEDELLIGILGVLRNLEEQTQRTGFKSLVLVSHLLPFTCSDVISTGIKHLWSYTCHILAVLVINISSFSCPLLTQHSRKEATCVVSDVLHLIFFWFPSHIEVHLDRILHRLQVTHIENPQLLDAEVVSQRKLLEHLLCLGHIQPLSVTRCTHIVHMVVDAPSTCALCIGHTADITPVVIADKDGHIVRHIHTCIEVVLHLLIESPHLWSLLRRTLCHFLDDATLVHHDVLEQFRIGISTHRSIAITTHTDGHDVVSTLHTLDTLTEELIQLLLILCIVPRTPFLTVAGIFLMVACHRFVMARTHNHTHFVSRLQVLRVVSIESPAPHGRPQHITLQTQNQFEHLGIELMAAKVGSKRIFHP